MSFWRVLSFIIFTVSANSGFTATILDLGQVEVRNSISCIHTLQTVGILSATDDIILSGYCKDGHLVLSGVVEVDMLRDKWSGWNQHQAAYHDDHIEHVPLENIEFGSRRKCNLNAARISQIGMMGQYPGFYLDSKCSSDNVLRTKLVFN